MESPDLGWDVDDGNNNWDLNAVLRFASRGGPISPPPTNNNPVVARYAPPPPPQAPSYAATVLFNDGGLGHPAIAALPQPQQAALMHQDQDLPSHPHAAAGWGAPNLDLPPLVPEPHYTTTAAVADGTPEHDAPPLNNEIPMPLAIQPPADKHTTKAPSSSSDGHAEEGSSRRSKKRGKNRKGKDRSKEVHLVPADDTYTTPLDSWAWRKYGEKSIKGTPFHRSYYRCSTDKSCKARKQVQRCLDQPSHLAISYAGEHTHPMPLVFHCKAGTTRPKTPPPQLSRTLPFTICSIPARENKAPLPSAAAAASLLPAVLAPPLRIQDVQQPAPEASATALAQALQAPVPYLPNTPLPPSPLPNNIPVVAETPALPANASARRLPLPPVVSPLLSFQAGEERPTHVIPPAPVVPTTQFPPLSVEFDNEEDDDAVDIRMLLEDMDMDMTPEDDALVYVDPEEDEEQEPLDGVGNGDGDGLLIQQNPEELAPSYSNNNCDEENMMTYPMAYDENASGGSGSNNSLMFPPSPVTYYDYQTAAALGSSGSAWTGDGDGDGAGATPCVQPQTPQQPAAATDWDWEW